MTWILVCNEGSLVGLRTRDYKSLCAADTICVILVNTQTYTDRHTAFDQLIRMAYRRVNIRQMTT